jgi:hypothetical protein
MVMKGVWSLNGRLECNCDEKENLCGKKCE